MLLQKIEQIQTNTFCSAKGRKSKRGCNMGYNLSRTDVHQLIRSDTNHLRIANVQFSSVLINV